MAGEFRIGKKGFGGIDESGIDGGTGGHEAWAESLVDGVHDAFGAGGKRHEVIGLLGEDHDAGAILRAELVEDGAGVAADLGEKGFHAAGDIEQQQEVEIGGVAIERRDADRLTLVFDEEVFGAELVEGSLVVGGEQVEADLGDGGAEGRRGVLTGEMGNQTK